jgi:hypothetical protein
MDLTIPHPATRVTLTVSAPVDEVFGRLLDRMGWGDIVRDSEEKRCD